MHKQIIKIKKYEGNCFIIKNFLTIAQIKKIQEGNYESVEFKVKKKTFHLVKPK